MSDNETLKFKIGLSGTSDRKQPEFKILLNGTKMVHETLKSTPNSIEYFEFDAEVAEGKHFLEIELLNKTFGDTITDSEGNILSDLLLNIDSIEIDDIDLGSLKWSLSEYKPNYPPNYIKTTIRNGSSLPESVKNCVNLGWNGTWTLPFDSPFYIWLLESI